MLEEPEIIIPEISEKHLTQIKNSLDINDFKNIPKEQILEEIEAFKAAVVHYANKWISTQSDLASIKEIKDIVEIINTIEKSYKNKEDKEPQVNILIQNIIKKFDNEDV